MFGHSLSTVDQNPYASPRDIEAIEPAEFSPAAAREWSAELLGSAWAFRRLLLHGDMDVIVEYNARGLAEKVYIDDQLTGRAIGIYGFASPIQFNVVCDSGFCPARIEVRTSMLFLIGAFRLIVGERVLYSEGDW